MSKEQDEISRLRNQQQNLESEKSLNDNDLKDIDPNKESDRYHETAQESKRLGGEIDNTRSQLSEVEAAQKEAVKEAGKEAGATLKEHTQEVTEVDNAQKTANEPNPSKADSSQPELDTKTADKIESIQQGEGNNHETKTNNGLEEVSNAQEKAQEQAEKELGGAENALEQDQDHEPEQ